MATIRIEIKDGYEALIARRFNMHFPDDNIPPKEELLEGIKSHFDAQLKEVYEQIVNEDPEVLQIKQQLEQKIAEKRAEVIGANVIEEDIKEKGK